MQTPYDAEYFLNGVASGKSNYVNYSWQEEPTIRLATRITEVLSIKPGDSLLDYGCARGFLVKAMRRLGIEAYGYDISQWAIENCDPEVKDFVFGHTPSVNTAPYDHITAKDVLEHLEPIDLMRAADLMLRKARVSILIMVPLTEKTGGQYVRKEDDMDVTHKIRWPLEEWMHFFQRRIPGEEWTLQGSWHIPGLKPTSLSHPKSCGFITLRRI